MKVPSSKPPRLWSLSTSNLVIMTLGAANLSHERPGSSSWRQNASKKIDVAWQFPAAVIEYIGVGVKKKHRSKFCSPKASCRSQFMRGRRSFKQRLNSIAANAARRPEQLRSLFGFVWEFGANLL